MYAHICIILRVPTSVLASRETFGNSSNDTCEDVYRQSPNFHTFISEESMHTLSIWNLYLCARFVSRSVPDNASCNATLMPTISAPQSCTRSRTRSHQETRGLINDCEFEGLHARRKRAERRRRGLEDARCTATGSHNNSLFAAHTNQRTLSLELLRGAFLHYDM